MLKHFYDDKGKRYYAESEEAFKAGEFYIGVTSILEHIVSEDDKKFLQNVPEKVASKLMNSAADVGTRVHACVEADLTGQPYTVDPDGKVAFDRFLVMKEQYSIKALYTEKVLHHSDLWYAGTADIIGSATDVAKGKSYCEAIMDIKTGRKYHKTKFAMQTAAYMFAYQKMGGNPDGRIILHTPRAEDSRPGTCFYAADLPNFKAFLGALETFKLLYYYQLKAMHWKGLDASSYEVNESFLHPDKERAA